MLTWVTMEFLYLPFLFIVAVPQVFVVDNVYSYRQPFSYCWIRWSVVGVLCSQKHLSEVPVPLLTLPKQHCNDITLIQTVNLVGCVFVYHVYEYVEDADFSKNWSYLTAILLDMLRKGFSYDNKSVIQTIQLLLGKVS